MTVTCLDPPVDVIPLGGDTIKAVGTEKDAPLRPSPWHKIAHSLSEAPSPTGTPGGARRASQSSPLATGAEATPEQTPPVAALSTSQALRDWEALLAHPESDAKRHHLVHVPANSCAATPTGVVPKLAAERDKDGHIEYKLKLIDPSPERFERLVTQMLWRLKQGRGEAIYELGLAGEFLKLFKRLEADVRRRRHGHRLDPPRDGSLVADSGADGSGHRRHSHDSA